MSLRSKALEAMDVVAAWSGIRIMRDPLRHPLTPDVTTLDIPGYRQIDSFSCGPVVGLMLVHTWHPRVSPRHFYDRCLTTDQSGTPTNRLVRALRQCGVGVSTHEQMKWRDITDTIDEGFPVATVVGRPDCLHWVLIYGVGINPDRIYLAGNSIPVVGRTEYDRYTFENMWDPYGFGLVCWGKELPRSVPRTKRPCKPL